jgi:hypothetical protein
MQVRDETYEAYFDCTKEGEKHPDPERRKLHFRASQPVSKSEAISIMQKCIPCGYNDFDASVLNQLPDYAQIFLARESSVCIYVKGKHTLTTAQETNYDPATDETRFWWD